MAQEFIRLIGFRTFQLYFLLPLVLALAAYCDRMDRVTVMFSYTDPLWYAFSALSPARCDKYQSVAILEERFKWLGVVA